jgi:hypothetical protein
METSPKNTPWIAQRVVYDLMATWFDSVHTVSIAVTFAIHDLCLHRNTSSLYVRSVKRSMVDSGEMIPVSRFLTALSRKARALYQ